MEKVTFTGTTNIYLLTSEQLKEIVRETLAQIRQPLEMMSASEVKQQYDVSDSTLWRWQRAGLVHPVRIGRERKYDRREIESMFAK